MEKSLFSKTGMVRLEKTDRVDNGKNESQLKLKLKSKIEKPIWKKKTHTDTFDATLVAAEQTETSSSTLFPLLSLVDRSIVFE